MLSTVHSAKGQEWDAVHVLNVADGNFPSEFSTGRAEQVEEERRLLYVAMTRAVTWGETYAAEKFSEGRVGVDVAGKLRAMWN